MNQKIYNLIILDASGSMYSIRNEAIAGVVETIQTIRTAQEENADQEQMLSLVVFISLLTARPSMMRWAIALPICDVISMRKTMYW